MNLFRSLFRLNIDSGKEKPCQEFAAIGGDCILERAFLFLNLFIREDSGGDIF